MDVIINHNESLFLNVERINGTSYQVCYAAPPNIVSDGLWAGELARRIPMKSSLPLFELQVLVIFAITQICNFFLKHLDFPQFISQMIAGLILGPSIQIEALDNYKKMLLPYGSQDTLATISAVGFALFVFTTGVQMDLSMVTRTGHKAWTIAIIGIAAPFIICLSTVDFLVGKFDSHFQGEAYEIPVVVLSQTVISFAVTASLLKELKILNSELGRLALSSVLVGDILGTTMACIANVLFSRSGLKEISVLMMSLIAFLIFVPLVCRPAMFWIIKHTPEGRPVDESYIYIIIIMVFAFGWFSVQIHQEFIIGVFVLGLAVPEGPPLGSALVTKLQLFGTKILLPLYVTCNVMKADFSLTYSSTSILAVGFFIVYTHLIKMTACTITALFCKIPLKDALTLGLILNCKGVVDVGLFNGLYDEKAISSQTYGVMVISIMIIACIVKWSVKILYDPSRKYAGYQKRNIMNLKPDSDLRIVACLHKQNNITAITDVLDLCSPSTEHPIIVDVLHLIELVGRTTPIFISHRLQRTVSGAHKSYSDDVILAFDLFEHDNRGAATAHIYTAISPPSLMHEDVCQLALDKVASIIILPFHKKWSIDGGIESDDKNIRSLNCKVLEVAPCSVGILVSRFSLQNNSFIQLAMVYLGGKDDREALCLAKRAVKNPRINLVVYHLTPEEHVPNMEYILDNEALHEVKNPHNGLDNVSYQRITVNDGPETSAILRDLAYQHDFFIVGRRHGLESPQTEGLTNWSEFSELGVIGDLLASPDFESRAGVLVVQQQVKD
ncbi:Sodium/solute symporter superfamily [Sesbania bispinosa]|nr:Sodium/solute symporter superfamily [Sesbania bispinosa]